MRAHCGRHRSKERSAEENSVGSERIVEESPAGVSSATAGGPSQGSECVVAVRMPRSVMIGHDRRDPLTLIQQRNLARLLVRHRESVLETAITITIMELIPPALLDLDLLAADLFTTHVEGAGLKSSSSSLANSSEPLGNASSGAAWRAEGPGE